MYNTGLHQSEKKNFKWSSSTVDRIRETGMAPELCNCTCSCAAFCKHCRKPRLQIPVELPPHARTNEIMTALTSKVDSIFCRSDLNSTLKRHLTRIREGFAVLRRTLARGFLNGHPINKHIDRYLASLQTSDYAEAQHAAKEMYTKHYYEGGRRGKQSNKRSTGAGAERFSTWIKALKDLAIITLRIKKNDPAISQGNADVIAENNPCFGAVCCSSFDTITEEQKKSAGVATSSSKPDAVSSNAKGSGTASPTASNLRTLKWMDELVPRVYMRQSIL